MEITIPNQIIQQLKIKDGEKIFIQNTNIQYPIITRQDINLTTITKICKVHARKRYKKKLNGMIELEKISSYFICLKNKVEQIRVIPTKNEEKLILKIPDEVIIW